MSDLFSSESRHQPLAARMRPDALAQYMGQTHLLGPGKPLREAVERGQLHSMILWGPPGVGKTTFARLLAKECDARFATLSAVLAGVKEIRQAVAEAQQHSAQYGRGTILFVDEVHRFNKAQQDAFLPYVEEGTVTFVGATTENPAFELNNALLSRCRVYLLRNLSEEELLGLLRRALEEDEILSAREVAIEEGTLEKLARAADGDARSALNLLEIAFDLATEQDGQWRIDESVLTEVLSADVRRFDKGGDHFYDQISALHKAVRGSDPDAALYWFARMVDGGCDPLYIARRAVRMASEDIGNADPRGLQIALSAWDVQERLGSPEGELAIAQAIAYLAVAPKSNAVYTAYKRVLADIRREPSYEVPVHLRNAPTKLAKSLSHGAEYRYAHDEPDAFAAGENYLPEQISTRSYYHPVPRGLELKIGEKLDNLRKLNQESPQQRYSSDKNLQKKAQ
ncbi:replication-associated recombination protein A [Microbulbifer flavimaris]|uniref:Replication-associated recombination protein A n=1 Tax=Microbulbifer flavimaris TaxID=1781068 RepID=A0ABX4I336_9GAMM|nr:MULTISPECIES: replication-associated recombination protein A [Microbulbifer]KUJ84736.1 recombination factor protein RarA [Microbulbifer sp. ZGT114]PCO06830.1 replication-associated recombination protein A [Microbulbifer flavimaris]